MTMMRPKIICDTQCFLLARVSKLQILKNEYKPMNLLFSVKVGAVEGCANKIALSEDVRLVPLQREVLKRFKLKQPLKPYEVLNDHHHITELALLLIPYPLVNAIRSGIVLIRKKPAGFIAVIQQLAAEHLHAGPGVTLTPA